MRKLLSFCLLCCFFGSHAQQTPVAAFKQKAFILVRFLEKYHYKPVVWNDSSSAMLYDKWLAKLDGEKLFLTQTDISTLQSYKTKLDDELLGKEWKFFDASINIYHRRLQQVDSLLQSLTAKPIDLTKSDNMTWPFSNYAANEQEIAQRWLRFIKYRLLDKITDDISEDNKTLKPELPADFAKLELAKRQQIKKQELNYIRNLMGTTVQEFSDDMQDSYLNSIAWCYDPHTEYMNLKEKKEFETMMSASEYSAGFDYEENEKGDKVVGFLQPGGSAWRSGKLHSGDVLQKVKINNIETNVADMSEAELDKLLGGNNESDVEITVKTVAGEQKTVKLVKEKITDEESIVKSYVLHGARNIAYINLPGFYSREDERSTDEKDIKYDGCANDVSKEIVKLKKDTIAGLILDLRYNGGGSMWEAMQLAGIFIDIGPVASVKEKDGKVHFMKDPNRGTIYDGPMIVLINGASASASEFLSAALQDYNRALIVGGSTYGKGTAQQVMPMDTAVINENVRYTDFVKVTGKKFYRIDGSTVQWKAVVPDIPLPDLYAFDGFKEKANKSALQPDNSKAGFYEAQKKLPMQELKTRSDQRTAGDPYFKSIGTFNEWMNKNRKSQEIPLQWSSYVAYTNKFAAMFDQLEDDGDSNKVTVFTVGNNLFDKERVRMSTTKSQEINNVYLAHVQSDKVLAEAYQIMLDWISK